MKKLGLILLVLLSANSFAGEWSSKVYVKEVSYSLGSVPGFKTYQIIAKFNEAPKVSFCNQQRTELLDDNSGPAEWDSRWLSLLLSAQAQNKPVRIWISSCDSASVLRGVKVVSD